MTEPDEVGSRRCRRPLGRDRDRDPGSLEGRRDVLQEPRGVVLGGVQGEPGDRGMLDRRAHPLIRVVLP